MDMRDSPDPHEKSRRALLYQKYGQETLEGDMRPQLGASGMRRHAE